MIPRPDLLDARSPHGIELFQLTSEPLPSCHIYMEAQIFTPDAKRFVLHRAGDPHHGLIHDPRHRYLVCDLENECALSPITDELGATAPSLSPDGVWMYYIIDETTLGGGRILLKRVKLDGTERETLLGVDSPIPGTHFFPYQIYPLSSISSDGAKLATSCFMGDGQTAGAPFGMLVFDLQRAAVDVPITGTTWNNMHVQYCRSLDPYAGHDIMIQEGHGAQHAADGTMINYVADPGCDIHLIHDDGSNFRDFPWGRDGNEFCQGHQCWIGRTERGLCGTGCVQPAERQLIASPAAPSAGHIGINTPGAIRNDMSRLFDTPQFCHFATDIAGRRLITDHFLRDEMWELYHARFTDDGSAGPLDHFTYLLSPRTGVTVHSHPFLSPDGKLGFFNSDESGELQAYMIQGMDRL